MFTRMPSVHCGIMKLPQYSEKDWFYTNKQNYDNANRRCSLAKVYIEECNRACDELHERAIRDNQHIGRTYEERIKEINFWKNEADNRVGRLQVCINRLLEFKDRLRNALAHYSPLLTTVSQCLLLRTDRQGIERVDDKPQQMLQKGLVYFQELIKSLEFMLNNVMEQIRLDRNAVFRLNQDLNDKYAALDIDMITENISLPKPPLELQPGFCPEPRTITIDDWLGFCKHNIKRAEEQEEISQKLYTKAEKILNECYRDFHKQYNLIIESMEDRIEQIRQAKTVLENHLAKVIKRIENINEPILRIQESIDLKLSGLSQSQIRLNARRYRPHAELCRDKVELELEREIIHLDDSVQQLQTRMKWAKNMLRSLHSVRLSIEDDIRKKSHTIYVDEVQCLPLMEKINVIPF
ncbi:tektin-1-like isoform X1 [Centruroides vittatus]|uniref:tektin-1-like isoform X1 n=1 Tax=Centruroides vittatus TaxID=120091 RepID=UPI00350FBF7B